MTTDKTDWFTMIWAACNGLPTGKKDMVVKIVGQVESQAREQARREMV